MAKMVPEKFFEWVELLSKQDIVRTGQWMQLHPSYSGFKEKLHPSIKIPREGLGKQYLNYKLRSPLLKIWNQCIKEFLE